VEDRQASAEPVRAPAFVRVFETAASLVPAKVEWSLAPETVERPLVPVMVASSVREVTPEGPH